MPVGVDTKAPLARVLPPGRHRRADQGADTLQALGLPAGPGRPGRRDPGRAAGAEGARHGARRRGRRPRRRRPRRRRTSRRSRTRCSHGATPSAIAEDATDADGRPTAAPRRARRSRSRRTGAGLAAHLADRRRRPDRVVLPILWTILLAFQRGPAAQPAHRRHLRATTASRTSRTCSPRRVPRRPAHHAGLLRRRHALAIGLGLVAALRCGAPFRGRALVRACMLMPYVAPVVAATFVWTTMLNPQFGIVNHYAPRARLGRADRVPEPARSGVSLFGLTVHVPVALLTVIVVRGLAVLPVRVPVPHRPAAGGPRRPRGGRAGRRRDADPAVPLHRAAAAAADDRGARRAAVHLDVQQLRRHLPAHRRRRRHPGGRVRVYDYLIAAATSARLPPRRSSWPRMLGVLLVRLPRAVRPPRRRPMP